MEEYLGRIVSGIGIIDIIDVAIIAFIIYKVLGFIKKTRAEQLVKGLLVLILVTVISDFLGFYALHWILITTMQYGVFALLVVFQPELRRGLEYVGRVKFLKPQFANMDKEKIKTIVSAIAAALDYFSTNKVGALIVMERETALNDLAETGVVIDSDVSTAMIENLFYVGTPLHDGAVIIRGSKIYAAGCVLPLTKNLDLDTQIGTRHRAGIGITEISDAVVIIVSEETGIISTASDGKLTRFLDIKSVEKILLNIYLTDDLKDQARSIKEPFLNLFRRKKDASK
jgi:diadenylate cyclase